MYRVTFYHEKHGVRSERLYTPQQKYLMECAGWHPCESQAIRYVKVKA